MSIFASAVITVATIWIIGALVHGEIVLTRILEEEQRQREEKHGGR